MCDVIPWLLCLVVCLCRSHCSPATPLQVLWWQKLLPELCDRTRAAADNSILLAALKGTVGLLGIHLGLLIS